MRVSDCLRRVSLASFHFSGADKCASHLESFAVARNRFGAIEFGKRVIVAIDFH